MNDTNNPTGDTYVAKLIADNAAWLDEVAENDIENAVSIAKLNGAGVAGEWGTRWLESRGFTDHQVVKSATALQRFESRRIEFNKASNLPPDSINAFLAAGGRELYADVCRADAERTAPVAVDASLAKSADDALAEFDRELEVYKRANPGRGVVAFTETDRGRELNRAYNQARTAARGR